LILLENLSADLEKKTKSILLGAQHDKSVEKPF